MNLGELKIASGSTSEGFALMEEASFAAVNGELTPFTSGVTACRMISACRDLTDYRRATEWIEATEKYCKRQSVSGFPGVCRIHRAEVTAVSGAWERAEQELQTGDDRARGLTGPAGRRPTATTRSATSGGSRATSPGRRRRFAKPTPAGARRSPRSP